MAQGCIGCKYHRNAGATLGTSGLRICHYMLDTGEPRGCPADNCTKYTKRDNKKPQKGGKGWTSRK